MSSKGSSFLTKSKESYIDFVNKHPQTIIQIEGLLKTAVYLYDSFSKDYGNSILITEIVTATNNLFSYANACFLLKSKRSKDHLSRIVQKIRHLLSVIEFSQTFVEITIRKTLGDKARWIAVAFLCIIKVILQSVLLFYFNTGIYSPSRFSLLTHSQLLQKVEEGDEDEHLYVGKRTGRAMRTLQSAASEAGRRWSDVEDKWLFSATSLPATRLATTEKVGEMLHICRPVIHRILETAFRYKIINQLYRDRYFPKSLKTRFKRRRRGLRLRNKLKTLEYVRRRSNRVQTI